MISVEGALNIILGGKVTPDKEEIPIQSAGARILSQDILAPHDQPPWDNSAMDGYAVRWEDIQPKGSAKTIQLKVIEVISAGKTPEQTISKKVCAKIMTGARIPPGADTIVPVEVTEKKGKNVVIQDAGMKGSHIRLQGEDVRRGSVILKKGKVIRPSEIAMLASLGKGKVPVYKKPVVAVLSSGDELADLHETRTENKIFNSNGYALSAQVLEAGGEPLLLGIAADHKSALLKKFQEGKRADILIVSGGVSMGDFDYVKESLSTHGKMHFWKVAMRPGSPMAFGEMDGKPFFGLPGNPVSCMVTFKIFVEPLIKKWGGALQFETKLVRAKLSHDIEKKRGMRSFSRGVLSYPHHEWVVRSTGEQGSHLIHSMVEANCLMDLPEEAEIVKKGEEINVIPF
ncbi:MAG: molybdopterin molybdotransferase MoeA [Nitrospirae bacterium]|nr:molybdopterin molybdotransferase MoeA [Nitrospirota bacterium]